MFAAAFMLVIAFNGVLSQRPVLPELIRGRAVCQSFKQGLIKPESYIRNPPTVPTQYQGTIIITNTAMPAASPKTALPVMPFVTELPNCPDLCFSDILTSPLGCLDPILNVYGTGNKIDVPIGPMLPAASPISAMAPFSNVLPATSPCDRDSHFLTRVSIPPPFI